MNEKETVIIVHGTWAEPKPGRTQWYGPIEDVDAAGGFVIKLNAALRERGSPAQCWAHCDRRRLIFSWAPSENSWLARTRAAYALAEYVRKLQKENWRCHVVAHSHGGNVVVEALPLILAEPFYRDLLGKIVTLGTPFIYTMSPMRKKAEWQKKWIVTIGLAIFCIFIAMQFIPIFSYLLPNVEDYHLVAASAVILFIFAKIIRNKIDRLA